VTVNQSERQPICAFQILIGQVIGRERKSGTQAICEPLLAIQNIPQIIFARN